MTHFEEPVTVVDETDGAAVDWTTFDASPHIPAGTTTVYLRCFLLSDGLNTGGSIEIRANTLVPSTVVCYAALTELDTDNTSGLTFPFVPLDTKYQSFDYKVNVTGDLTYSIQLIGYL